MTTTLPTNSSNITLINPRMSSTNTTASPNDTTTYLNINDTGIHYWMEVSVNVTGPTKTEKELRSWFSQLFSDSSCMSSQYPSSSPIPRGKGHSDSQLLKGIEVRCSNVTDIRMAECFVILWMEPTVHPCCLLQTLCQAGRFQSHNISGITQSVRRMENQIKDNSSSNCGSIPYGCNATVPENKTCADLSTAFIPTGSLSNNCSTPVEDKIIPTATDLSTDVYYSTLINVSVSGDTKNESDVNLWLQELFDAHLDGCMTTTITPAMPSSTNDLPSSKLRGLDVFCAITTEIRTTSCNVVLKVERGVEPCCLLRILCQAGNHSSSHISGTAQRMDSTGIMKPSNSNSECGDSVLESCMALPPDNATCRNNFTVFSPQNQTCPTEEQVDRNQHPCNCSAFCNGTDTYYTFKLHFNKDDLDLLYSIPYLISGLGTQCTNDSGSTCLPQIANSYKDNKVDCAGGSEVSYCTVILSFSGEHYICDVSAALKRSFYIMRDMYTIGQLNRAALCGNATYQDNPLNSSFTWYKLDLTPSEFCLPNATNFLNCQQASYVVELSEHCEQSGSTAGPYTNTTFLPLNTTLPNMNMTSSPENTTYSPLNTTSSPLNTTYSPLNTTYSPENTTYSPLNTTSSPLNTTYSPLNTTSSPLNTTSSPMNVTSIPLNTTSIPLNTTSSPMNVTSIPLNTTSIPLNTTSSPMNVTSIPQNTTSIPLNTTSSPMNTTSIPLNMTSSPMNVTLSPPNVTSRPVNTTAIPVDITGNVTVTTPNMTPTSNTTLNNVSTTNEILTTAFNGSTGGFTTELPTTGPSSTTQMSNEAAADLLLQQTRNVSSLNSSQVDQLVSELGRLLEGPNVSVALGNTSVHIVSNLLGASQSVLASSSQRIVEIVDTVGLKLVFETDTEELLSDSLALSVKAVDGANFRETTFSITDPANVQVRDSSRRSRSLRSTVPQGSIRLPPTLTQNLNSEEQQQASRVQFNFYQTGTVFQDPQLGTRRLISGILGASVANLSIAGLQENVTVNLRNTEPVPGNYVAICVFWDLSRNDGRGGWNSDGCFLENSTDSVTTCSCNHLTSFAILLDLSREPLTDPLQATILTFITYIGCGLSSIFLSLTLLTYLAFEKLRKDMPSKILIQLCLALLMLNMVFLVDSWLSLYPDVLGLCISTAWFLHYFLLASFTWMGLEAVHMYLALVKVFNTYVSHYMLKFSLVGWGVPLVVVIIVIAVDKDNYGMVTYSKFENGTSDGFCWLLNDTVFYVGVVAYFCVIFLFNSIMFVVVMVQLHRILRQNPHSTQHRSTLQDLRRVAGVTILLGLTWGFAFFAWGPVNLAFMYLFTIFNTLQGFFIFVFHCAVKENVRRQWRTYLCCGKLRLAENSDWSRTATQKIDKRSAVSRLTSLSSSESNSSSDSSFLARERPEQLRGIANPLTEQAITADEALSSDNTRDEAEHPHSL